MIVVKNILVQVVLVILVSILNVLVVHIDGLKLNYLVIFIFIRTATMLTIITNI